MKTPLTRLLIGTCLAVALLPASTALAQGRTDLPVGKAQGVRLVNEHGGYVLIFSHRSAKLRKQINSRYAWIACTQLGEPFSGTGSGNLDIARNGYRVRTGFHVENADFCRFFLRAHKVKRHGHREHVSRRVLFSIPLTQAGAVYLDEEARAANMFLVSLHAALTKDALKLPGEPTYGQLVQENPRLANIVVQLAAPGDTPPPNRIGYYSDGREHVVLAIVSASGKRLFIERSAGDVLSTNVAGHLYGDDLALAH